MSLSKTDISNYVQSIRKENMLSDVTNVISRKYGRPNYGFTVLEEYVKTGNINLITRTDGARDLIKNMDIDSIIKYLNKNK